VKPKGCKLAKPDQDGVYRLPLGFNLTGTPCESGALLVGGLRLPTFLRAGPPTAVLIRSARLGAEAYTARISATKPAGFEVCNERALGCVLADSTMQIYISLGALPHVRRRYLAVFSDALPKM